MRRPHRKMGRLWALAFVGVGMNNRGRGVPRPYMTSREPGLLCSDANTGAISPLHQSPVPAWRDLPHRNKIKASKHS